MFPASSDVHLSLKATFGVKSLTQFLMKLLCIWPRELVGTNMQHAGKMCVSCWGLRIYEFSSCLLSVCCPQTENGCVFAYMMKISNMLFKKIGYKGHLIVKRCHLSSVQNCGIEAKALMLFRCSNPLDFLGIHWFQWEWGAFSSSGSCFRSENV